MSYALILHNYDIIQYDELCIQSWDFFNPNRLKHKINNRSIQTLIPVKKDMLYLYIISILPILNLCSTDPNETP